MRRGEIFGYLGPNGAGKTTTIRLLLDFIRPTRGESTVLRFASPWYWYLNRNIIAQGPGAESFLPAIVLSAVLAAVGV